MTSVALPSIWIFSNDGDLRRYSGWIFSINGDLRLAYLSALCKYTLSSQMTVVIVYLVVGGGFCCWMSEMMFSFGNGC